MDIIKQNAVNAKSHTSVSTLKVKGIHHMSGRKTFNLFFFFFLSFHSTGQSGGANVVAKVTNLSIKHPTAMLQVMQNS